jgi:hypothetical protein
MPSSPPPASTAGAPPAAPAAPPPLGDRFAAFVLKLSSAVGVAAGVALVLAGVALQSPPKAPVPA